MTLIAGAAMPSDSDGARDNPYEASAVNQPQTEPSKQPKVRTLAASFVLVVAIVLASGAAFVATCAVGAVAGVRVSQAAGAVSEGAMGYGVMTGLAVGGVCGIAVASLLSLKLFRRGS